METKYFTLFRKDSLGREIKEYSSTSQSKEKEIAQRNFIEKEKSSGIEIVFGKLIPKDQYDNYRD
jgi:hypothetical protein